MTSNKLGVALMVWLLGVSLLGGRYYFYPSKMAIDSSGSLNSGNTPLEPFANVVAEKPVIVPIEELGLPSTGTTHIEQTIIAETDNPYSMTDEESVRNFNASAEGQFIRTLFIGLNSSKDTVTTQDLANFTVADLSTAIKISPILQRMFYGYRPSDDPNHFLYDDNLMHQFHPHTALLYYVQRVRPDGSYRAQMRGSILPKLSKAIPTKIKVAFGERDVMYLVRQSVGSCLVESLGPETQYFEVSFQFNIGIPHDIQTEGYPLLLWPNGLRITLKPIDKMTWETANKTFFVKGG